MKSTLVFYVQRLQILKTKNVFGILSVAALKAITRKLPQPDAPSVEDWYNVIYEILIMETMACSMLLQEH